MFDFISKEIMAWMKVIIVWYQISVILLKVRHGIQFTICRERSAIASIWKLALVCNGTPTAVS